MIKRTAPLTDPFGGPPCLGQALPVSSPSSRYSPLQARRQLLAAAPPLLRSLIVTALDTGMRRGEMLALRWRDVDLRRQLLTLRGETTKSQKTRVVPISTQQLIAVLKWLHLDASGQPKSDDAAVFSYETGESVKSFRTAWVIAVLKGHGIEPHWRKAGNYKQLTESCQEALEAIDLHWHDLRHEYASRLVERGVPLAQVRDLLGHASITTTERYDNQTLEALQSAAKRLEAGKPFDPTAPVARTNFQESFKNEGSSTPQTPPQRGGDSEPNALKDRNLGDLAGRQGFEPRFHGPEPRVLPLNDLPARAAVGLRTSHYRERAPDEQAPRGLQCGAPADILSGRTRADMARVLVRSA